MSKTLQNPVANWTRSVYVERPLATRSKIDAALVWPLKPNGAGK